MPRPDLGRRDLGLDGRDLGLDLSFAAAAPLPPPPRASRVAAPVADRPVVRDRNDARSSDLVVGPLS